MKYINICIVLLISTCGLDPRQNKKLKSENEDLRTERDVASEEARAAQEAKKKSDDEAAAQERLKVAAERDAASARQTADDERAKNLNSASKQEEAENARKDAEAAKKIAEDLARKNLDLKAVADAEAEASKRLAEAERLKALAAEEKLRDLQNARTPSLPLKPFDGVWILDATDAETSLNKNCSKMLSISAAQGIISEYVICDDGKVQTQIHTPTAYGVMGDLFPRSLGFAIATETDSTLNTCAALTSAYSTAQQFVFDQSTRSGAEQATYLFALSANSQQSIFNNTSSRSEFARNNSCENIVALAAKPENTDKVVLQQAARICSGNFTQVGCFSSTGFVQK